MENDLFSDSDCESFYSQLSTPDFLSCFEKEEREDACMREITRVIYNHITLVPRDTLVNAWIKSLNAQQKKLADATEEQPFSLTTTLIFDLIFCSTRDYNYNYITEALEREGFFSDYRFDCFFELVVSENFFSQIRQYFLEMLPELSSAVPFAVIEPFESLSKQCDDLVAEKKAMLARMDDMEAIIKMTVQQLKRVSDELAAVTKPVAPKPDDTKPVDEKTLSFFSTDSK